MKILFYSICFIKNKIFSGTFFLKGIDFIRTTTYIFLADGAIWIVLDIQQAWPVNDRLDFQICFDNAILVIHFAA